MTMEKWVALGIQEDYAVFHPAFRRREVRLASPLRPALARLMLGDPGAHPEGRRLVLRDVGLYLTALGLIETNGSTSAAEIVEALRGKLSIGVVQAELDALLEQELLCLVPERNSAAKCRPTSSWTAGGLATESAETSDERDN
ncbi:hypothetical protein [Kitasatospora sp. NPDC001527]|uniref:hypothetical protein n=1 Tax=Kitasatospora sp. NPDC001527 TaxID=3154519 RepID=UPI00331D4C6E